MNLCNWNVYLVQIVSNDHVLLEHRMNVHVPFISAKVQIRFRHPAAIIRVINFEFVI